MVISPPRVIGHLTTIAGGGKRLESTCQKIEHSLSLGRTGDTEASATLDHIADDTLAAIADWRENEGDLRGHDIDRR